MNDDLPELHLREVGLQSGSDENDNVVLYRLYEVRMEVTDTDAEVPGAAHYTVEDDAVWAVMGTTVLPIFTMRPEDALVAGSLLRLAAGDEEEDDAAGDGTYDGGDE